jgi:hypothetical protein
MAKFNVMYKVCSESLFNFLIPCELQVGIDCFGLCE